jgi:two-component system chemotaxis sensor kinase CheA
MNIDIEFYRRQFYQEARDILETLNENVLQLEVRPEDRELINSIFRGIHTIKGSAGSFDLDDISSFAHYFESLLSLLRDGVIDVNPDLIDLILAGIDHLFELINSYEKGTPVQVDNALVEKFNAIITGAKRTETRVKETRKQTKMESEETVPEEIEEVLRENAQKGLNIYKITLNYDSETFRNGYDPLVLLKNISDSSSFYKAYVNWRDIPSISDFNPYELYLSPTVYIATELSKDDIIDLAFDRSLIEVKDISFSVEAPELIEDETQKELLREFLNQLPDFISALEASALEYESTGSPSALNNIFRIIHTIKGDSSYLGIEELSRFAHTFESFLEKLRSGEFQPDPEYTDVILRAIDDIKDMTSRVASGEELSLPDSYRHLQKYLSGMGKVSLPKIDLSEEEWEVFIFELQEYTEVISSCLDSPLDREKLKVIGRMITGLAKLFKYFNIDLAREQINKALNLIEIEDFDTLPEIAGKIVEITRDIVENPDRYRAGKSVITTEEETKQVPQAPSVAEEIQTQLMETKGEVKPSESREQPREQVGVLRVEERKVDQLSNLVGELLVARNTYEYLLSELAVNSSVTQSLLKMFKDNYYLISRLTQEMNQQVASLRMVPLRGVFSRFNRVVRDISRRENKKIRLVTDGEDIEVDKKIADILSEPLIHLVRNACDHGIESPQERIEKGKPEEGTVILRAFQEGTDIIIKVIDDGKGIDRRRIYEKAISLGLDVPQSIEDPGIFNLIFLPGFSTKEVVTDISGRGVGMDVVRNAVTALGGKIDINSREGEGTEITLTIPTSIGITLALMVEANGEVYAIPMDYIVETVKVPVDVLKKLYDRIGFYYRGEILPVERLDVLLSGETKEYKSVKEFISPEIEEVPLVVIKVAQGKYGIAVDRLLRNMEITIKPMPDSFSGIDIFSGVSISGDGRVILVLNPERLV